MGVLGSLSQGLAGREPLGGGWEQPSCAPSLHATAASWEACPALARDAFRNRQFLATFAFDLVQRFRAEEALLKAAKSPQLGSLRQEHHHLALWLRDLMAEAELGLDVTPGIRAFLVAWRVHEAWVPGPAATPKVPGH